ncbi:hypothetical protein LJC68_07740, partial [Bacteroidales bacterium OttesenSCG-928-B11]|nr:hypothetical protein [Bacteroidales bacterium OttesenSCG-928-B11]
DLFFERMNAFLDSILRNGESVDRSKSFWAISFSDSFYEYNSALIYYCPNVRGRIIKILLEIVFLFDERNRIKMVDLSIIRT